MTNTINKTFYEEGIGTRGVPIEPRGNLEASMKSLYKKEKYVEGELFWKNLPLLGKILLPIGMFSGGLTLGLTFQQHIPGTDLIIGASITSCSILGTNVSMVYDK